MFQLAKTYGTGPNPYRRTLTKPVAESVRVAVNGIAVPAPQVACDATTGRLTFAAGAVPAAMAQLELARKASDASFYDQAVIDARVRELQEKQKKAKEEAEER